MTQKLMKMRYYTIVSLLLVTMGASAQGTYLNDRMTNNSDVIGTARYVGMGGAMGALGADISVISNNPAGIGLMRRGTFSFTLGGNIQDEKPAFDDGRGTFVFDQMGFVAPVSNDGDGNRVNFAFNYQKKIDFNHSLFAIQPLRGLSQCDAFAWTAGGYERMENNEFKGFMNPMYNGLEKREMFSLTSTQTSEGNKAFYHTTERGQEGNYYRLTWGSLRGFELNLSGSIQDRGYLGLTFGIDHMKYDASASYEEVAGNTNASYVLYQDQRVRGYGFNLKFGGILRPMEDSPLRVGLAIETPTWYELRHESWNYLAVVGNDGRYEQAYPLYDYYNLYDRNEDNFDNYLKYLVYTPWKFRCSVGSTVQNYLAWDVEYEYSMNNYTKMGYPNDNSYYEDDRSPMSMDKDREMNRMTHRNVRGVHNLRAGLELKPSDEVAVRVGYNFYSKPFENDARLDLTNDSYAMLYNSSTEYINLGATNIITIGLGYAGKHFYADLAYKYRAQKGDFYAFDDNFSSYNPYFIQENPMLRDVQLTATEVNLDRHGFNVTLGWRF